MQGQYNISQWTNLCNYDVAIIPPSVFSCISFSTTAKYSAVLFMFSRSSWLGEHEAVVFQCVLNPELLIYALPQRQLNGRSFRCNLMCNFKCTYWVKRQVHRSHGKGLSPVWSRRWVFRFEVELNFLWHSGHSCGRSPIFPKILRFSWFNLLIEPFFIIKTYNSTF